MELIPTFDRKVLTFSEMIADILATFEYAKDEIPELIEKIKSDLPDAEDCKFEKTREDFDGCCCEETLQALYTITSDKPMEDDQLQISISKYIDGSTVSAEVW